MHVTFEVVPGDGVDPAHWTGQVQTAAHDAFMRFCQWLKDHELPLGKITMVITP